MISADYFHGTSTHRLQGIRVQGFKINERDNWANWLCARGVYFVLNRPLVALYSANRAVLSDARRSIESQPIVLKACICLPDDKSRILDLTKEDGMLVLYGKYLEVKDKYGSIDEFMNSNDGIPKAILAVPSYPGINDRAKRDYISSITANLRKYEHFKWDCAVITQLVNERNYAVVYAVFQEGVSAAYDHFAHIYKEPENPSYQGIRYRDAIIACVVDLNCIDPNIEEISVNTYPECFVSKVSNIANDRI